MKRLNPLETKCLALLIAHFFYFFMEDRCSLGKGLRSVLFSMICHARVEGVKCRIDIYRHEANSGVFRR